MAYDVQAGFAGSSTLNSRNTLGQEDCDQVAVALALFSNGFSNGLSTTHKEREGRLRSLRALDCEPQGTTGNET